MGDLSSLFLFTAALCIDSFTASFICGAEKIRITKLSAWILAFCPAAVLTSSSALGTALLPLLPKELPVFLSSSLLVILGLSRFTAIPPSSISQKENVGQLSPSASFFLAMGLSSDNGAAGLGAGLAGTSLVSLFFFSLLFSLFSVHLGCLLGRQSIDALKSANHRPERQHFLEPSRAGGLLLVLLGLMKLL